MNEGAASSSGRMCNVFRLQKEDNTLTEGAPSSQQQLQQQQRDLIMALCGHHASIYYGEEVAGRSQPSLPSGSAPLRRWVQYVYNSIIHRNL